MLVTLGGQKVNAWGSKEKEPRGNIDSVDAFLKVMMILNLYTE